MSIKPPLPFRDNAGKTAALHATLRAAIFSSSSVVQLAGGDGAGFHPVHRTCSTYCEYLQPHRSLSLKGFAQPSSPHIDIGVQRVQLRADVRQQRRPEETFPALVAPHAGQTVSVCIPCYAAPPKSICLLHLLPPATPSYVFRTQACSFNSATSREIDKIAAAASALVARCTIRGLVKIVFGALREMQLPI